MLDVARTGPSGFGRLLFGSSRRGGEGPHCTLYHSVLPRLSSLRSVGSAVQGTRGDLMSEYHWTRPWILRIYYFSFIVHLLITRVVHSKSPHSAKFASPALCGDWSADCRKRCTGSTLLIVTASCCRGEKRKPQQADPASKPASGEIANEQELWTAVFLLQPPDTTVREPAPPCGHIGISNSGKTG